jgi:N-acetylglucosamine-6-sulfatase
VGAPSRCATILLVRVASLLIIVLSLAVLACGADPAGERRSTPPPGESAADTGGAPPGSPNIVFVLTDDQHPASLERMRYLREDVGSRGVAFENTVAAVPLCCPDRATLQRGQYAHNHGVLSNGGSSGGWEAFRGARLHESTAATWLHDAGYTTGHFGKYLNSYNSPSYYPPGWDRWYGWNGGKMGWAGVNDQGTTQSLDRAAADGRVAQKAANFLEAELPDEAPVFASVNFGSMHEPYYYPQGDRDEFRGATAPRGPAFNEADVSDKPAHIRNLPPLTAAQEANVDAQYREALRSMLRVDRFIRRTTEILHAAGEYENTYFVYYTDNGAHFGEHRLEPGKLQPYVEDTGFPLYVRGPGIPAGATSQALVGSQDVAPTLAAMGGAQTPAFVDGRSVLPLAQNPAATGKREAILSEWISPNAGGGPYNPPKWWAVRTADRVYVEYETGERELYDLEADPHQLHNIYDTKLEEAALLARRLKALKTCAAETCRKAEGS